MSHVGAQVARVRAAVDEYLKDRAADAALRLDSMPKIRCSTRARARAHTDYSCRRAHRFAFTIFKEIVLKGGGSWAGVGAPAHGAGGGGAAEAVPAETLKNLRLQARGRRDRVERRPMPCHAMRAKGECACLRFVCTEIVHITYVQRVVCVCTCDTH
jgi:hypothetical protein